ncbi:calcium-binding protein [Litoreibacter arenae]|uniref:Alkaline phosphatase n=1 Tax=Litoreibacter arenae DSM 19593 TaxID=1123360 RepID=S9RT70_9RHOB|nr:calcium-binding protein [Litoreibacter arenae]EPX81275.1 Alkaline phosphatase [Litoreibacter arenae DSM 19593]
MPGRYANVGVLDASSGIFTLSGRVKSDLADVYDIKMAADLPFAGSISITLSFGPQGRNFDSELELERDVELELKGIGITLGEVKFGGETVLVTINGTEFIFGRADIGTRLVAEVAEQVGSDAYAATAQKAAEIIEAGMDAVNLIGKVFVVNSTPLPPSPTFTAKFEDVVEIPDEVIDNLGLLIFSNAIGGFPTVDRIEIYGENYIAVVYDEDLPFERAEIYYRDGESIAEFPAASLASEIRGSFDPFIVLSGFGYAQPGEGSDGLVYILDAEGAVQAAFDNSFDFGTNEGDRIVDGTSSADVIDASFVDADGDAVTDVADTIYGLGGDDTINSGNGADIIYGGDGNDTIDAGRGSAVIDGGTGNDIIYVIDSSVVDGGAGDDYLFSNLSKGGDHTFTGGSGADTFEFAYASASKAALQTITDFEVGIDTLIVEGHTLSGLLLDDLPSEFTTSQSADGSLVLNYGGIHSVTLSGVTQEQFFVETGITASATVGTSGDDIIDASFVDAEGDTVSDGAETIFGLDGNDIINAGKGNDTIYAGDGNDTINPDRGSKTIYGENGDDTIYVIDSSIVDGGAGDDHLFSNLNKGGDHTFTGGAGADTFEFAYTGGTKAAIEVITDFEVGIDALIIDGQTLSGLTLAELPSAYTTSAAGDGSLVLSYGGIHSVTLVGVTEAEFFML